MWYLIQNSTVYDISRAQYAVKQADGFFWVEASESAARVGDRYANNKFEPALSLREEKNIKMALLQAKRDEVIRSGVVVNAHRFYTDDGNVALIHQAITMEGLGIKPAFPRVWGLADGSLYEVSFDEMKEVAVAIADRKDACYANYFVLKEKIDGAITRTDLEAIDINTGWPAI